MTAKIRKTRPQLPNFLREHGHPYSKSTLDKLCAPSIDQGPPVDAWIGNRPLYDPEAVLAWAEARLSPARRTPSDPGRPRTSSAA